MKYLSVCSGIEAATSAWHHMGWEPVAFSEIEPFPSAVLKHHYPNVPNLGDMTKFKEWKLGSIDLLVGGTPCQSFSVAGLRKGLDDPRGNLMLTFGAIARHFAPRWLVWENVPGVLSSNGGRDFGTFLGMLGELGYGFAYRVLDAQYFGVAQRRRRVFVVGCLGDWRSAAAVLFELASMSGNPPPSRQKGQGVTPGSSPGPQYGGSNAECADTVTSKWAKGSGGPSGNEGGLFVAQPVGLPEVMSTLLSSTAGVSRPGNAATEHETYIPMCFQQNTRDEVRYMNGDGQIAGALAAESGMKQQNYLVQPIPFGVSEQQEVGHCLRAGASKADKHESTTYVAQVIAFNGDQSEKTRSMGESVDHTPTLRSDGPCHVAHPIAQPLNIYGGNKRSDRPEGGFYVRMDEDTSKTLDAASGLNPTANQGGTAVMQLQAVAFSCKDHGADAASDIAPTLRAMGHAGSHANGGGQMAVATTMAVRRLTPRECERLQGFPDDHTLIPWRGKDASQCPDGPRYKALGNSMAVPVMAWIGERIRMVCELQK